MHLFAHFFAQYTPPPRRRTVPLQPLVFKDALSFHQNNNKTNERRHCVSQNTHELFNDALSFHQNNNKTNERRHCVSQNPHELFNDALSFHQNNNKTNECRHCISQNPHELINCITNWTNIPVLQPTNNQHSIGIVCK